MGRQPKAIPADKLLENIRNCRRQQFECWMWLTDSQATSLPDNILATLQLKTAFGKAYEPVNGKHLYKLDEII